MLSKPLWLIVINLITFLNRLTALIYLCISQTLCLYRKIHDYSINRLRYIVRNSVIILRSLGINMFKTYITGTNTANWCELCAMIVAAKSSLFPSMDYQCQGHTQNTHIHNFPVLHTSLWPHKHTHFKWWQFVLPPCTDTGVHSNQESRHSGTRRHKHLLVSSGKLWWGGVMIQASQKRVFIRAELNQETLDDETALSLEECSDSSTV